MLSNRSVGNQIQNLQSLFQAFQNLYAEADLEYDRETVAKLQVERRNIELIQTRDKLTHHILHTLERINHQIKQTNINQSTNLRTVNTKHQSKNNNQQLLIQNQYYFKLPQCRFDIKNIQVPHDIQTVVQQFDNQYQTDKNNLENQITKLKILIKLAQMNQDDNINKHSKTRKNI